MNTPKFKEGDWIKSKKSGTIARVNLLLMKCYDIETIDKDYRWLDYEHQDNWELTDEPHTISEGLVEAANNYASVTDPEAHGIDFIREVFIAGAEWRDEKSGSSETPRDLEEAAGSKLDDFDAVAYMGDMEEGQSPLYDMQQMLAMFIAGAKWQEEQEQETIELAEDHAFLAGSEWQKEQMMREAIEGEVCIPNVWVEQKEGKELVVRAEISKELGFKFGDKVRVIVIPKDD